MGGDVLYRYFTKETPMALKYDVKGAPYLEAPYTPEEEDAFYKSSALKPGFRINTAAPADPAAVPAASQNPERQ